MIEWQSKEAVGFLSFQHGSARSAIVRSWYLLRYGHEESYWEGSGVDGWHSPGEQEAIGDTSEVGCLAILPSVEKIPFLNRQSMHIATP